MACYNCEKRDGLKRVVIQRTAYEYCDNPVCREFLSTIFRQSL